MITWHISLFSLGDRDIIYIYILYDVFFSDLFKAFLSWFLVGLCFPSHDLHEPKGDAAGIASSDWW